MENSEWDVIGFVISSRYRILAIERLAKGPAPPSQIAREKEVGIAHVSRALQDLQEKDLVDLLVSEDRKKGRVYGITETGRNLWNHISEQNMQEQY